MSAPPRTAEVNGRLWGARARDWADVQEAQFGAGYDDVLTRAASLSGEAAVAAAHAAAMAPFRQADGSFRIGARYMALLALA